MIHECSSVSRFEVRHQGLRNGFVVILALALFIGCDDEGAALNQENVTDASSPFFDRSDTPDSVGYETQV